MDCIEKPKDTVTPPISAKVEADMAFSEWMEY